MMDGVTNAIRQLQAVILNSRRRCYQVVFDREGANGREAERVLADLRDFCFAERSTFDPDPQIAAFRAGKRETFLRIMYFLNLDESEVRRLVEVNSDYVDD